MSVAAGSKPAVQLRSVVGRGADPSLPGGPFLQIAG